MWRLTDLMTGAVCVCVDQQSDFNRQTNDIPSDAFRNE